MVSTVEKAITFLIESFQNPNDASYQGDMPEGKEMKRASKHGSKRTRYRKDAADESPEAMLVWNLCSCLEIYVI